MDHPSNAPPSNGWVSVGGCNNDPPPTISRWAKDEFVVLGAGVSEINGTYKQCGEYHDDAIPRYVKKAEYHGRNVEFIIHSTTSAPIRKWRISTLSIPSSLFTEDPAFYTKYIDFYAAEDTTLCLFEDPAAAAAASKLSRLSISSPADKETKITDLPEWAIREIIDYIPKTSRALLALALTTDPASWREIHWNKSAPKSILSWFKKGPTNKKMKRPSAVTKIILSPKNADEENMWEKIDFADVGFGLCFKLTDDDIAGMLACINAVQQLKSLYLTYCIKITGRALEPLRGSNILEQLDLSLHGNHHGDMFPLYADFLEQTEVIPILYSIIGRESHSLRHLNFPIRWPRSADSGYFDRFLETYNQTEYQQSIRCRNCSVNCRESLSLYREDERFLGLQNFTCYDCLNHYCYNCKDDEGQFYLTFCNMCVKLRCKDCQLMKSCRSCSLSINEEFDGAYFGRNNVSFMCKDCCEHRQCDLCEHFFCHHCQDEMEFCDGCNKRGCEDCMQLMYCEYGDCEERQCANCRNVDAGGERAVDSCTACSNTFCFKHRLEYCKEDWDNSCTECLRMIAPRLAHGYEIAAALERSQEEVRINM
jgi:hypothetical protein